MMEDALDGHWINNIEQMNLWIWYNIENCGETSFGPIIMVELTDGNQRREDLGCMPPKDSPMQRDPQVAN